jgi:acetyl esterase/lipase
VGNAELESSACIGVTNALECISINLEHRLSPEFKFRVAYEDCWDALLWVSISTSCQRLFFLTCLSDSVA